MNSLVRAAICTLFLFGAVSLTASAQNSSFRIDSIHPYDKGVPGQILALRVDGLQASPPVMLDVAEFKIEVIQDGVPVEAKLRTVTPTITFTPPKGAEPSDQQRKAFQSVSFVVPQGLRPGAAELKLSYRNQWSNTVTLTVLEQPIRPVVGSMAVVTMGGPPPTRSAEARPVGNNLGWRLERGVSARAMIEPLVDPDDPNSAILIRFKQGDAYYEAVTRVTNHPANVQNRNRSVSFMPARDVLELEVPAALAMGQAEVEIRIKANGKTSEPVTLRVTITDTARTVEAPGEHAPRILGVSPNRTGAGQSILLSIDQLRGLEPDPAKTIVFIEQDAARYAAIVERNSALTRPNSRSDDPVALIVRTSRQIIGHAQVRIFNPLRGESAGTSQPVPVEILPDVQPPQVTSVNESTEADLAELRRMYDLQRQAGRQFPEYDPARRYLTIRTTGIDYNPNFVRITLEQAGRSYTLSFADFSSYFGEALTVRLPVELQSGKVKFAIANLGVGTSSTPVVKELTLR